MHTPCIDPIHIYVRTMELGQTRWSLHPHIGIHKISMPEKFSFLYVQKSRLGIHCNIQAHLLTCRIQIWVRCSNNQTFSEMLNNEFYPAHNPENILWRESLIRSWFTYVMRTVYGMYDQVWFVCFVYVWRCRYLGLCKRVDPYTCLWFIHWTRL